MLQPILLGLYIPVCPHKFFVLTYIQLTANVLASHQVA